MTVPTPTAAAPLARFARVEPRISVTYIANVAAVGLVYVLAALAGLSLDRVSGFATLVWPPTGLALAAVLIFGWRVWPGIFVGALVANLVTGAAAFTAAGIATGNTLEALAGGYALLRVTDFRRSLDGLRDVIAFLLLAVVGSTAISATIGSTTLLLSGVATPSNFADTWSTWGIGDAIGALLVAPVILTWIAPPRFTPSFHRAIEAAGLTLAVLVASLFVFWSRAAVGSEPFLGTYLVFPLLMWAAIRFGQRGAITTSLLVSAIAVAGTVAGRGPFVHQTTHDSLFALQTFIGVSAATFLLLGASSAERDRSREQLRHARDVASGANAAKSEFLAVMSHELRTPLNAIAGYSELLSMGVAGRLNAQQMEAVSRIRTNQEHLLALIDDVLSFARLEAGQTRIDMQTVHLCDVVESVETLLRPQLTRKSLKFLSTPCSASLVVRADPVKLRQILLNILGNSIKFTPAGGTIEMTAAREKDKAIVRISDTGIGIPPDMIDRVFEPFFQVQNGTTREYTGAGLGLAIARDFARAMGGDIGIESLPGQGCQVSVSLALNG
ncbi:MAG TPA: MASE1 domain-containing protein [Gemmatimonadaceae bacterium]|nr:MASE1 domain-containing protein [Gemmatimonadaceae bacterium]